MSNTFFYFVDKLRSTKLIYKHFMQKFYTEKALPNFKFKKLFCAFLKPNSYSCMLFIVIELPSFIYI